MSYFLWAEGFHHSGSFRRRCRLGLRRIATTSSLSEGFCFAGSYRNSDGLGLRRKTKSWLFSSSSSNGASRLARSSRRQCQFGRLRSKRGIAERQRAIRRRSELNRGSCETRSGMGLSTAKVGGLTSPDDTINLLKIGCVLIKLNKRSDF